MSVSVLARNSCPSLGEGPHWDEKTQNLLYIDIESGAIHKYDIRTGEDNNINLGKS